MNGDRKSLAEVRIVGLNLQGKPQKASFSMFSFANRELQTTIFILQFSIGAYKWTVSKTFEELREFHNMILTDSTLRSGREYFTVRYVNVNIIFSLTNIFFSFLFQKDKMAKRIR